MQVRVRIKGLGSGLGSGLGCSGPLVPAEPDRAQVGGGLVKEAPPLPRALLRALGRRRELLGRRLAIVRARGRVGVGVRRVVQTESSPMTAKPANMKEFCAVPHW